MKKIFCSMLLITITATAHAAFTSCGPGYILTTHSKIDGIPAAECQKLWCRDLETGKSMGSGNAAASGYRATSASQELCDANGNCIECFGERKWCSGEVMGGWNPEYGAYTRSGDDTATYTSYLKGSCFAWRLEQANCEEGKTAILQNGEWICTTPSVSTEADRASSIRRTGGARRILR